MTTSEREAEIRRYVEVVAPPGTRAGSLQPTARHLITALALLDAERAARLAAEAALRQWRCESCSFGVFDHGTQEGRLDYVCDHDSPPHRYCKCVVCDGTGIHSTARAALRPAAGEGGE